MRQFARCHSRSTHTIVQNEGTPGIGHPDRGYDLFVTSAVSDGIKMWDVRSQGDECVQKYDSHIHTRHQCGTSLSPCMRYLATGGEDGHVYVYDTRHVRGYLQKLHCAGEVITDVAFSPGVCQIVATSLEGYVTSFSC